MLPHDTVADLRADTEHGVMTVASSTAPGMVSEDQLQAVRPLQADLRFVTECLTHESRAHAVIATAFRFGWKRLSAQCTCLYVDADADAPKNALIQSGSAGEVPTIIVSSKLTDLMATAEDAVQVMGLAVQST